MKAEFLKIAGVKSEAEFYKKFPNEEAFMKKHGKAVKKLMAKKAQIGATISNIETPKGNLVPIQFTEEKLKDAAAKLTGFSDTGADTLQYTGGKSQEELRQEMMETLQMQALQPKKEEKKGGLLSQLSGLLGEGGLGDLISGGGIGGGQGGGTVTDFEVGPLEQIGAAEFQKGGKVSKDKLKKIEGELHKASKMHKSQAERIGKMLKKGGKVDKFEPHMMYDPKTGKGYKANKLEDHLRMEKLGYTHEPPKAQEGGIGAPQFDFDIGDSGPSRMGRYNADGSPESFLQGANRIYQSDLVQNWALPIAGDVMSFIDQTKAQKQNLALAKQARQVAEITLQAAKTEPEKVERQYVRPEDVENTGEEFFPIYGVGTNILRNGGMFSDPGYVPLQNVNQVKSFGKGGVLGSNSYLVPKAQGGFDLGSVSYGGGQAGGIGMQLGDMAGFNNDAGSNLGGKIGGTIGSAFGPIGSAVGSFIGSGIGDLLDRDDRRTRIEQERAERATKELAYSTIAPQIQAGYASHMKQGGKISANPTLLDTMAMGGDVKTTWGGKVETVSYNPYAGGESIEFKGNSHDYVDPRTGQTGIGVAYGKQSVANNEAVVEVENEPAQQLRDGGGTENLVVYGDLKIPEEYVAEIGDDRAKGKKFKNYVSDVLNKDEAKINKKMEKAANLGLESDNTVFGQLERATADAIINGGDMKLKNIAEKKNILADLQSALNDTFDEYGIKGNEFINKNKITEDPERVMNNMAKSGIEINPENKGKFTAWARERGMSVAEAANKVMANTDEYSPGVVKMANFAKNARKFKKGENGVDVPKLQNSIAGNVSKDDFNKQLGGGNIPTTDKTPEELLEDGWVRDKNDPNLFTKKKGDAVEAVQLSGKSLGYTPPGQSIDKETGLAGGITMEQISELERKNPWFGKFDLTKPKVKHDGKMVHPDVLRFQQEYNKRIEGTDIKPITKVDGVLGQETFGAEFTPAVEGKEAEVEKVKVAEPTTEATTTVAPQSAPTLPMLDFRRRQPFEALDPNQLLGEQYAMATSGVQPVFAQGYQPSLRVPYDISLQAAKNDVISQSRALQRNPRFQNNPAALALAQAPTFAALNKLNETEFIANQRMKDAVYSANIDTLNKAKLMNLGIFDKQQDRLAEATAKTRTQNIDILNSISDKYAQRRRDDRLERIYSNLYPTYQYDEDGNIRVVRGTTFNTGQGNTGISPFIIGGGIGGGQGLQQLPGVLGGIQSIMGAQQQFNQQQRQKMEEQGLNPDITYKKIDRALNRGIDPKDIIDYAPIEEAYAKKGKTVKKNRKNSNILRALRDL